MAIRPSERPRPRPTFCRIRAKVGAIKSLGAAHSGANNTDWSSPREVSTRYASFQSLRWTASASAISSVTCWPAEWLIARYLRAPGCCRSRASEIRVRGSRVTFGDYVGPKGSYQDTALA
jgi:hypothetical protein